MLFFLRRLGLSLVVLVLVLIIGSYLLPSVWKVERSISVQVPASKIYPLVADFKNGWSEWSVFEHDDPAIQYAHSGKTFGVGAERSWTSKKVGSGSQKIIAADPNAGIEFEQVMTGSQFSVHGEISLRAANDGNTNVTWTGWGETGYNPLNRWMSFFIGNRMGKSFEVSLVKLKALAETGP